MSLIITLFLVLLILKLTGVVDWSWWVITSPLWISVISAILCVSFWFTTFLFCLLFAL